MSTEAELALRQQRLLARSAALRASFAEQAMVLDAPFAIADRVHDAACWAWQERMALIGAGTVVFVLLRPRRVFGIVRLGFRTWRRTLRARSWLRAASALIDIAAARR